jgi:hypothetical protein
MSYTFQLCIHIFCFAVSRKVLIFSLDLALVFIRITWHVHVLEVCCTVFLSIQVVTLICKILLSSEIMIIVILQILALALEGRSRRGTRRRPNTSGYRKLDSNLEEAVTSKCSTSVTHVIY